MSETDGFDESKKGLSIASLVVGIVGILFSCSFIGFILGILAIIFGGICLNKKQGVRGMALAGLILGIVTIVLTILGYTVLAGLIASLYSGMAVV